MEIKELFYRLSLNRMNWLSLDLKRKRTAISKLPEKAKKVIKSKESRYKKLKKQYRIVLTIQLVCFIFIYISFLSIVGKILPGLMPLGEQIYAISGSIGVPVFTILVFLCEKAKNVLIVDAILLVSEVNTIIIQHKKL